ncbi:MAG: peptidoglycan-associated lipoprotein Pal [Rhodocyclaceae bacterium]
MKHYQLPLAALTAIVLAACSSTPTQEPAPVANNAPIQVQPQQQPTTTTPVQPSGNPFAVLRDPNNILSKRSVYFDFDSYVVNQQYVPLVEAHARFLKANPSAKVLIQGNTDERGSSEYNLALGQKRADAVKKNLSLLGVPESQVESVSLGKEKPKAAGHDEASWAQNRRSDILYNGEF